MFNDCTIIIRSSGERTVPALQMLLEKQVSEDQIFEVNEVPLAKSLKTCYEIGIEDNRRWIVILDGDTLPFEEMLSSLTGIFKKLDDRVFGLQCKVLDKMTNTFRHAGIHMHRTKHLKKSKSLIPKENQTMRPESITIERMAESGHPTLFIDDVLALHDYEQYYKDLFRKGYFLAHKSTKQIPYLIKLWSKLSKKDKDYLLLLEGLKQGRGYNDLVFSDISFFNEFDINQILINNNLAEKKEIDFSKITFNNIDNIYKSFEIPQEFWHYKLFDSEVKKEQTSRKRRFKQLHSRIGTAKLFPWMIGKALEKAGRLIKQKLEA